MVAKRRYTQCPAIDALSLRIGYLSKKSAEKNEKTSGQGTAHSLGLATMILPTFYQVVKGYQNVTTYRGLNFHSGKK